MVVWPMKRPDLFTGLRSLPKGTTTYPATGLFSQCHDRPEVVSLALGCLFGCCCCGGGAVARFATVRAPWHGEDTDRQSNCNTVRRNILFHFSQQSDQQMGTSNCLCVWQLQ